MTVNIKEMIMKPIADGVEALLNITVILTGKGKLKARPKMPYCSVEIISIDSVNPDEPEESEIDVSTDGDYDLYSLQNISARIQCFGENAVGLLKEFELMRHTIDWSPLTVNSVTSVTGNTAIIDNTDEERAFLNMQMSTIFSSVVNSGYFDHMEGTINIIESGTDDTNIIKSVNIEAE